MGLFDGETLTYEEHGPELNIPQGRDLYEPSLTRFNRRYYLTLRADHSAYVTRGEDGIHFEPVREWKSLPRYSARDLGSGTLLATLDFQFPGLNHLPESQPHRRTMKRLEKKPQS